MVSLLRRRAETTPDAIYLEVEGSQPISYGEMLERSEQLASALLQLGIDRGDAVATLMETKLEGICLFYACGLIGAVFMPINVALRGSFLEHQLRVAKAAILFTDTIRAAEVAPLLPRLGEQLKAVVLVEKRPVGGIDMPVVLIEDVWRLARRSEMDSLEGRWDDPALVLFTSGTTGPSKAVVLSHNYLMNMATLYCRALQFSLSDCFYSGLPLFHLSGGVVTLIAPLVAGARGAIDKSFSVSRFWQRINETGATHTLLLGAMSEMLWQRPPRADEETSTLRAAVVIPIRADLYGPFERRFGLRLVTGYGMTEVGQITFSSVDEPCPPGTSGSVVPEFDVIIADEDGFAVEPGMPGEILVRPRSPHLAFEEYAGDPDSTLAVTRGLWFHTGDIGSIDRDGWFRFHDRKKDYLRRRGENISSYEVENALLAHPDISEAAVIGVPSELGEDDVKACVVLAPSASLTEVQLLQFCVNVMPYYAVPRYIDIEDSLPRNAVGRIQKFVLRERHEKRSGWDREEHGFRITKATRWSEEQPIGQDSVTTGDPA